MCGLSLSTDEKDLALLYLATVQALAVSIIIILPYWFIFYLSNTWNYIRTPHTGPVPYIQYSIWWAIVGTQRSRMVRGRKPTPFAIYRIMKSILLYKRQCMLFVYTLYYTFFTIKYFCFNFVNCVFWMHPITFKASVVSTVYVFITRFLIYFWNFYFCRPYSQLQR